jgi:hypothetical protein
MSGSGLEDPDMAHWSLLPLSHASGSLLTWLTGLFCLYPMPLGLFYMCGSGLEDPDMAHWSLLLLSHASMGLFYLYNRSLLIGIF